MNYYQRTAMYIRILVFMLALLIGVIIYGFISYADDSTANNYEELKTCVYNTMLNRQSSVLIKYTGADYQNVISNIRQDKMLNEIKDMDNLNVSDDGIYMMKAAYDGFNFSYQRNNNAISFTFNFTWDENSTELNYVNNEVNRIINETGVRNMNNAYDRAVALRDYLANNVTYGKGDKNTPYTALTTKNASCHSFSLLYYKLLTAADVKCYYVTGNVAEGWHAWNIVKLGDKWYNIDVTYESSYKNGSYSFKGSNSFINTHRLDAEFTSNTFVSKYNISQDDFDRNSYAGNDLVVKTDCTNNNQCVSKDKDASVVLNNKNNGNETIEAQMNDRNNGNEIASNQTNSKKVEYDNSPKTGDVTPLIVCIVLAIISMVICTFILIVKKKRG